MQDKMFATCNDAPLLHDGAELLRVAQRKPAGRARRMRNGLTDGGGICHWRPHGFLCKPWGSASGDGQALAAFGAARVDHGAAAAGFHAYQKTMRACTTDFGWLVSTFHGHGNTFRIIGGLQGWSEDRCRPETHGPEQPCTFREISEKTAIIPKKSGHNKKGCSLAHLILEMARMPVP